MIDHPTTTWIGLERVQRYVEARRARAAGGICEFCGAGIDPDHGHLVNVASRTLLCVCRPCQLLFTHDGAGGGRFRAVPDRYERLTGGGLDGLDVLLDRLQIPIGLAFFFRNSQTGRVTAFYPSPAGATESELPLEEWDTLVAAFPTLAGLAPDVEALLVRRTAGEPGTSGEAGTVGAAGEAGTVGAAGEAGTIGILLPIDVCYELVGRIRRSWRGFQGGDDVRREIDAFFTRALERASKGAHT